jgi:GNAT superfamily N-acetyltransferase
MMITVSALHDLPPAFAILREEAAAEGFAFLDRLSDHWRDASYKRDTGAALCAAHADGALVGIGAHTIDFYDPAPDHRRIRHFYVSPSARRRGVGQLLAGAIEADAFKRAARLHLRATHDVSMAFWDSLGFARVMRPDRTHEKVRP